MNGYIYVRSHPSYNNACKLGKSCNIPERDTQYATGEIKRGYFELVFEISIKKINIIERLLQNEFYEFNIRYDAGTEFYDKEIINLIEPYLTNMKINYKKLSKEEINNLVRCNRVRKIINKINIKSLINVLKTKQITKNIISYTPRNDQIIIIEKSVMYFHQYNKGILVLTCGVGKTLISLWITKKLYSNTILIGVPNKLLLNQWNNIIYNLFENVPILLVSNGIYIENIVNFLKNNERKNIVITTYSSAHKVSKAVNYINFKFDIKILDEVHHLTTNNLQAIHNTKKYIQILDIPSFKQLSLTATLKYIENNYNNDNIISNNSINYFGKIIDRKCLLWGINENIICDYIIQTIITDDEQLDQQLSLFNIKDENNKRLFLSAFSSLKSIYEGYSHHLLIYSNNTDNSLKLIQYINLLLDNGYFNIPELYYSYYHSKIKLQNQKKIINNFENSKFGIITCVYCLGEGYDNHIIDAVVFSENMTSNIRIVQSSLRASRKNKKDINKITKIILPILNKYDLLENNENSDLKKIREVIYQMGLEDKNISQKIKVFKINIKKSNSKQDNKKDYINDFIYDDEFTQEIKLRTIKRLSIGISYEKSKNIIISKNIKNKESYYKLCEIDNRLSKEPNIIYKEQFINWIEYLSIGRNYYDLNTCKIKVNQYLSKYPDIKNHYLDLTIIVNKLCTIDILFPPCDLWIDYYDIKDLRDIIKINIINKKKKIGVII